MLAHQEALLPRKGGGRLHRRAVSAPQLKNSIHANDLNQEKLLRDTPSWMPGTWLKTSKESQPDGRSSLEESVANSFTVKCKILVGQAESASVPGGTCDLPWKGSIW